MSNLQNNVNRLIRYANVSVSTLAQTAGVHRRTVDRIRGTSPDAMFGYKPSKETVQAFTDLFGVPATSRLKSDEIQQIADNLFN